jgi:hypothetical protein
VKRWGRRPTRAELDERLGGLPAVSFVDEVRAFAFHEEPLPDAALRVLLREALSRTGGNERMAAEILGISDRAINYHLSRYRARPVDLLADDGRREEGSRCVSSATDAGRG